MKTVKIKLDTPYKRGTADIQINDTPIQNDMNLCVALCEAEANIIDALELIYSYRNKGRNGELIRVIEAQFDCLRNQIMDYHHIPKTDITSHLFMEQLNARRGNE